MFWKVSGFSVTSPIDALLDKSQFTLEELLVEDDLIQECRSLNGRLINFLGNKENVEAMLRYMLEPPNDASETESKRFSWQCCEVFCCEVDPIFSVLLENVDTMSLFLSLLDSKEPLHTATAGYFGRVMSHLLIRRPVQLAQFLMSYPSYISKFIDHLEDTSITEVVIRLMGADEQTNAQLPASYVDWISRMDALKSVVDRLDASELDRVQFNAAQVLNAVIRVQPLSLATELASDAHLERLTQSLFTKDGGVSVPVLSVVIYALDPKMRIYNGLRPNCEILDRENVLFKSLVQKLSTLLPILTEKIKPKETDEIQPTPYGCLKPPLGFARLKIVQVLSILMDAKSKTIFDAVLEAGTLETLMDLFVSYPFNNALHKEIVLIFMRALSSEHRPTIECLFTKLKICQWLMELPQNVHSKMTLFRPHDSNSLKNGPSEETNESASPKLRAGYLGHAIQISNIIEQAAATHPEISRHIESYTEWQKYFASVVEPVNQKEDLDAWECGRPTDGIPRISEDDENRNPPSSSISNPNKLFGKTLSKRMSS